jgi:hypothetical protein
MAAKHIVLRAVYVMGLMAGMSLTWVVNVSGPAIHPPIATPLPDPPQVFSSFELRAINDAATGKGIRRSTSASSHQILLLLLGPSNSKSKSIRRRRS